MPKPRAEVGQRWWIDGLGWRVIVSLRSDQHGRLYGIRHTSCAYPLSPVSAVAGRGRYIRSRDLVRMARRCRVSKNYCYQYDPNRWGDTRWMGNDGYVYIRPRGRCGIWKEHRWMVEQARGRPLQFSEAVHHLNGIKSDNRLENLIVVSRDEHSAIHGYLHRIARARAKLSTNENNSQKGHQVTHQSQDKSKGCGRGTC